MGKWNGKAEWESRMGKEIKKLTLPKALGIVCSF
jgi:hypothetical protein